jgi:3-oxoacyl-[acyl-carrier protein] reductase
VLNSVKAGGKANVSGRVALVTGGARGIGLACAQRLAATGAHVAILDVVAETAETAASSLPGGSDRHAWIQANVTVAAEVARAVSWVEDARGPVDLLVNNAGILRSTRFLDISEEEWEAVMDVSVKGAFLCSQACLPGMLARGFGRIVNLSSSAGRSVSTLGGAHYTAAKAAMLGLTRAVAKETADRGVTVNAVCPGLFRTEMVLRTIDEHARQRYAASFPVGRLGEPHEVAALVSFLCSEDAAYITGAAIDINGGDLMR